VIAPGTENLNQTTFDLLKTYIDNGGKVLVYCRPDRLDGRVNPAVSALFDPARPNIIDADINVSAIENPHLQSENFQISDLAGGYVLHQRRQMELGQLLFLTNASLADTATGTVIYKGCGAAAMDLFTGTVVDYPHTVEADAITITFTLAPAGSLLLYISELPLSSIKPSKPLKADKPIHSEAPITCSRVSDNVLVLNYCDLTLNGLTTRNQYVLDAAAQAFKAHGFASGNPWRTIQFKRNIVEKDNFGPDTGFKAAYTFVVEGNVEFNNIKAVVEKPYIWTVTINGHKVKPDSGQTWLDRSFGVYTIGRFVTRGRNTLCLSVCPMSVHAEIEPVYILGDFCVTPTDTRWIITQPRSLHPGSWREQGLPFYSDAVMYSKEFYIACLAESYAVGLKHWRGTMAEVLVNGVSAGVIAYQPYQIDVSGLIRPGTNCIDIKVVGSLCNTIGPFFVDTEGIAGPNKWETVPDTPRPKHYHFTDYGLFDEVYLLQS